MIPLCILAIENESDREYMTWLYLEHERLMYSTIGKISKDQWLIEDVMQTSLEKLIDKVALLRTFDRKRLVNYIISTCKNTTYSELSRNARHPMFSFEDCLDWLAAEPDTASPEEQIIKNERYICLGDIWDQLSERSRYILEARYILYKSVEEIAKDLNIQPGSARMALTRARKDAYKLYMEKYPD